MPIEDKLEKDTQYFIIEFCEKIGPRAPCSNNETKAAKLFYDKLKNYSDEIEIEEFFAHPGAYKVSFRFPMILYFLSLVFYWIIPLFSLLIIFLSCLILFGEVYFVREIIDFIFYKKKSQNIISKIKAQDQVKLKLIMGCHLDSNWEFPLIRKFKFGFVMIIAINVMLNFFLLITLFIKISLRLLGVEKIFLNFEGLFYWLFMAFIPIAFLQLFFIISNKPVMGANDNLSGMAICYQIAKNFYSYENRLRNVELWINGYGCEEIGSKGSKHFVTNTIKKLKMRT